MLTQRGEMMNLSTMVVSIFLIAMIIIVLRVMIHNKRSGKSMCGGGCHSCGSYSICQQSQKTLEEYKSDKKV